MWRRTANHFQGLGGGGRGIPYDFHGYVFRIWIARLAFGEIRESAFAERKQLKALRSTDRGKGTRLDVPKIFIDSAYFCNFVQFSILPTQLNHLFEDVGREEEVEEKDETEGGMNDNDRWFESRSNRVTIGSRAHTSWRSLYILQK